MWGALIACDGYVMKGERRKSEVGRLESGLAKRLNAAHARRVKGMNRPSPASVFERPPDPITSPPLDRMLSSVGPNSCFSRGYDFSRSIVYKTELERSTSLCALSKGKRTVYGQA